MTNFAAQFGKPVGPYISARLAFALTLILVVGTLTPACSSGSQSAGNTDSTEINVEVEITRDQLQLALDAWRENERITGATMSVYSPATGQLDLASGLAKRSIDPDRFPDEILTHDTPMFVGDLTHTLVAALVIQLAEQGEITLDAPVVEWFTGIKNSDQITVRNLLEHTSGVPVFYTEEFLDVLYEQEPNVTRSPDEVISIAAMNADGSYFLPGSAYGYSKTNYLILGRIVELVTRRPLEAELQQLFFEPLDFNSTYLAGHESIPGGTPSGYEYAGTGARAPTAIDGHVPQTPANAVISAEWASGGLISTTDEIVELVRVLFESPRFAKVATEMLRPAVHPAQQTDAIRVDSGAGVFTWIDDGELTVGQFGFIYPFSAQFTYWTESKTVIAVIANEVDSSRNPGSNFQLPVIENLIREAKQILLVK